MPAVFRFAMDGESKNPVSNQTLGLPCRGKVLSFAYLFLTRTRRVLALRAGSAVRAAMLRSARAKKSRSCVSAAFNSRRLVKRLILPLHETFEPTQM
jgi:hypothetical protein